jgi:hypothetical protein
MTQIFKKINSILQEVDAIGKNKKNEQQGYKFRGIDDMYNALHPLFAIHGVFITSDILSSKREERQTKNGGNLIYTIVTCKFTFYAEDGTNVSSTLEGEAMDSGDKSTNKAMSTALKYALMQMFLIPTEEQLDTEYKSPEVKAKKDKPEPTINTKVDPKHIMEAEKMLNTSEVFSKEEIKSYMNIIKKFPSNEKAIEGISRIKNEINSRLDAVAK